MDFNLSADQLALQEAARTFAQSELPSIAREMEHTNEPVDKALKRRLGELGFMGVNLPQAYGGLGLGNLEALLVLEEFAQISAAVAFPVFESSVGPVMAICRFGSESLKKRIIPAVCRGEHVVAIAMSEPDAGSALTDLTTTARIEGDVVVLNGMKRWCSGGGRSDGYLVYCKFSDAPGAKGIGAVYVDHDSPGMSYGAREALMGWRGIYSADIFLDEVRVPLENIIVRDGGFPQLMEAFDLERCGNATMCLGIAAGAVSFVNQYTQDRKAFGKPLIDFQAVQLKLAEMQMQVEASRLLIHRAAWRAQQGFPSVLDSSMAKCFANEMVRDVTGKAMQLMGGYGYSKTNDIEQRFRDGWGWGIAGGAIDIFFIVHRVSAGSYLVDVTHK
ncbi:MAG: acyl-CoA dehydrogenase family protein [Pseudomonadota bacterium]